MSTTHTHTVAGTCLTFVPDERHLVDRRVRDCALHRVQQLDQIQFSALELRADGHDVLLVLDCELQRLVAVREGQRFAVQ